MVVERENIIEIVNEHKRWKKRIVFTNGCFDIIHRGHVEYLRESRALGDILIVGLNTDDSVKRLKGAARPVISQEDRAVVVSEMKSVDYVVLFYEDTPYNLIDEIHPNILVKGGDYQIADIVGADIVKKIGGMVVSIPFIEGFSTTELIERIKQINK